MSPHSQALMIAWGYVVLALISVIWGISAFVFARRDPEHRTAWWYSFSGWMLGKNWLFVFLAVVWFTDWFSYGFYVTVVWIAVATQLNVFIRWIRLGRDGRPPRG